MILLVFVTETVLGYFNIPFHTNSSHVVQIFNLFTSLELEISIDVPIRISEPVKNCLDNLLINFPFTDTSVVLSDYTGQIINLPYSKPCLSNPWLLGGSSSLHRAKTLKNLEEPKTRLLLKGWKEVFDTPSNEDKAKCFMDILLFHFESFPLKTLRLKTTLQTWVKDEIRIKMCN